MFKDKETMLNAVSKLIVEGRLKHKNTIVVGENNVGKTYLLKKINASNLNTEFIRCASHKGVDFKEFNKEAVLLIDDIDVLLPVVDRISFNPYVESNLKGRHLVLTTHDLNIIESSRDFNILKLYDDAFEVADGNDFKTYTDVREFISNEGGNKEDILLRHLLNSKLSNIWGTFEEGLLEDIKSKTDLTKRQLLLINEIER